MGLSQKLVISERNDVLFCDFWDSLIYLIHITLKYSQPQYDDNYLYSFQSIYSLSMLLLF